MTSLAQPARGHDESSLASMLARAEELADAGRASQAREMLETLLELADDGSELSVQVLSDLAVLAARGGDLRAAAHHASLAIHGDPAHAPALEVLDYCATLREQQALARSDEIQRQRIAEYASLSTCLRVTGAPIPEQPVLLVGRGSIAFGEGVRFGWRGSPGFYSEYAYVEACYHNTHVEIGDNSTFNNGATLRSEGPGISIGTDCLFGWSIQVLDSDFHDLHPQRRLSGTPATKHVSIGNNVFVGANAIIMKGVTIGDDTVVGAGSVVLHSLPPGVIAAGNPARVIRALED